MSLAKKVLRSLNVKEAISRYVKSAIIIITDKSSREAARISRWIVFTNFKCLHNFCLYLQKFNLYARLYFISEYMCIEMVRLLRKKF